MTATPDWHTLYPFQSHETNPRWAPLPLPRRRRGARTADGPREPDLVVLLAELVRRRDRYRVIAVDHIGCGLSDKPSPADYSYRLAQRIADLNQFIEKLDLRQITLVAHDWGGGIGMARPWRPRTVRTVRVDEYRRVPGPALPVANPPCATFPSWARWRSGDLTCSPGPPRA